MEAAMEQHIVTHFIWDCGEWVKVGEYACDDEEAVLHRKLAAIAERPHEGHRFETKRPKPH
jgi:hypothetical protein